MFFTHNTPHSNLDVFSLQKQRSFSLFLPLFLAPPTSSIVFIIRKALLTRQSGAAFVTQSHIQTLLNWPLLGATIQGRATVLFWTTSTVLYHYITYFSLLYLYIHLTPVAVRRVDDFIFVPHVKFKIFTAAWI